MTKQIQYKDKDFVVIPVTYGLWRKLLKLRKQALDSKDEYLMAEALDQWIKATTNATDIDIANWTLDEIVEFTRLVGESSSLPLQPKEKLEEPLSQEIQP